MTTIAKVLLGALASYIVLAASEAKAKDVAEVDGDEGSMLVLTDEQGMCLGSGRQARWVGKGGSPVIPGCWRPEAAPGGQPGVKIAFLDVDTMFVPANIFRRVGQL